MSPEESRAVLAARGVAWREARLNERATAGDAVLAIRAAAGVLPETEIARLLDVDRMTVRRALGKR